MITGDDEHGDQPYAELGPDRVLAAVETSGQRCDGSILALHSFENRVYQVGIEGGPPLIAKFYRPRRWSDAQILEEHAFVAELAEAEIPAVPPLVTDGVTLHHAADLRFAIYPREGGRAPDVEDPDSLTVMGRYLGRIHRVGSLRRFEHRPALDVASYGEASREVLLRSGFIPEELRAAYESVTRDLLERIRAFPAIESFPSIRIHGDCHMGNVLWREERPHFVDFDDARNGPAVQDLWMMLSGEREERVGQLCEILEGYETFGVFDPRQLQLIEPLRTLRLMHYAAWIARRWNDPAFPRAFPDFATERYWSNHILELREQLAALDEPPLAIY